MASLPGSAWRRLLLGFGVTALAGIVALLSGVGAEAASSTPGVWYPKASMTAAVATAGGVALGGKFYVAGGTDPSGADVANLSVYDSSTDGWSALAPMPIGPRYFGSTVAVGQKIYVLGGWRHSPPLPSSTVAIYDTGSGQWSAGATIPALSGCSAADAIGTLIYLYSSCDGFGGYRDNFFAYDTVANSWSVLAGPPNLHVGGGAAAINGRFYLADGTDGNGVNTANLDIYTPGGGWTTGPLAPSAREGMAAVAVGGSFYLLGGGSSSAANLNTVELYDTVAGSWSVNTALPSAVSEPAAAYINGLLYVAGGSNTITNAVDAVNALSPTGPAGQTPPSAPGCASASSGTASATVNFCNPSSDGGSPVEFFTVIASPGGASQQVQCCIASFSGLQGGTTYSFTVSATNAVGTGPTATTNPVMPIGPPDAPTRVYAGTGGNGTNVIWQSHGDGGSPLTGAILTVNPGGAVYNTGPFGAFNFGDGGGQPSPFQAGVPYTITVALQNAGGTSAAVQSNAFIPTTVPFSGPSAPYDFGAVPVGVASDPIVVNVGSPQQAPANIGQIAVSGPNAADFVISNDSCSNTTSFFQNCSLSVTFHPSVAGDEVASLDMPTDGPYTPTSGLLVGTGVAGPVGYLSLNGLDNPCCPPAIFYPGQAVGVPSPPHSVSVVNRGGAVIHLGQLTLNDGTQGFALSGNCSGATLNPGAACQVTLVFTPASEGNFNDGLSINSDASNGNVFLGIGGNGLNPPSAPTTVIAAAQDSSAQVAWVPVIDPNDPTSKDVNFTVTASPGGMSQSVGGGGQNVAFFTGLSNGVAYTFTVVASNPAGSSSGTSSNPVTPSPIFLQGQNFFGQAPIGYSTPEAIVRLQDGTGVNVHTGSATITGPNAGDFSVSFAGCSSATIYGGPDPCSMGIVFSPHPVANPCSPSCSDDIQRLAVLTLADDQPGSPRTLLLIGGVYLSGPNTGTGPVLSPSPTQLYFGSPVGVTSAPATVTITNTGNAVADFNANPQALQPGGSGKNDPGPSAFAIAGGTCVGLVLNPGSSCTLAVTMTAGSAGNQFDFLGLMGTGLGLTGFAYTAPPAPSNISVSPGDGVLSVNWDFQGGDANLGSIFAYRITAYSGGAAVASATIPFDSDHVITGLADGTPYTVTVAAINPAGASPESAMSAAATPGPAQLASLRPQAQPAVSSGIWFSDAQHGWSVGGDGVIQATTDGGATWHQQVSNTTFDLNAVDFVDSSHGWAVGQQQGGAAAIVLRTVDGGATWTRSTPPDVTGLLGVTFTSATHGWLAGSYAATGIGGRPVILGTDDGGATWTVQLDSYSNGWVGSISATDATHAWAVGGAGEVFATSDGSHWVRQLSGTNAQLNSVSFVDRMHGWIGGGQNRNFTSDGVMLVTSDGGGTWSQQTLPALSFCSTVPSINAVQFTNATDGWAVGTANCVPGSAGNVVATTNGGQTWTIREPVLQGRFNSLHFTDANHGWLGGEFGVIEATADGGANWTLQNNAGNFYAIAFSDPLHGVATGSYGEVYTTSDGGASWTFRPTGVDSQLNGVAYLDPSHVVAVGNGGSVLNSSDGGATWSEQLTPVANQQGLSAVGIVDPMHGWAVGSGGTILQLNGSTWTSVASPTAADLNAIAVVDRQHAWAAGGSTVVATADGVNWSVKATIGGASINGLTFTDALHGYAVGRGGAIYATADGGTSWTAESSGTTAPLMAVGFADVLHGWAAGGLGALVETIDGGAHWTPRVSGSNDYVLRAIKPLDPGHVLFAASGARVYEWKQTPTVHPASLGFSTQPVGTSSSANTATLNSSGSGDLRVLSAALGGPNAGDFQIASDSCSGATVPSAASCSVSVAFSPKESGSLTATLSLSDDGTGTPQLVQLTGVSAPYPTATTLSSSANPSVFGQPVTFAAAVTAAPGSGTPFGTVAFTDGGTALGSAPLDSTGTARVTTSSLSVAGHTITATFAGNSTYAASGGTNWTATSSMSLARRSHTATLLPNGKVLVAGGLQGTTDLSSAELYDPTTGSWSLTGSMLTARDSQTATLLANGKVLVVGGNDNGAYLASAELYNPSTGTWSAAGNMSTPRAGQTATQLPSGKVLVAGGFIGSVLASAELYDPATGSWSPTGSMTDTRHLHTATLLPSGKVLVTGGGDSFVVIASSELYDPATGAWSRSGSMSMPRFLHTATLLPSGKVLVAGGDSTPTCNPSSALASAELFDPTSGAWTATGGMGTARHDQTMTVLPSGQVLLTGGAFTCGDPGYASARLYDPAAGTWNSAGSMTVSRFGHTATVLPSGALLIAGGYSGGELASAELFDLSVVTQVVTPAATTTAATSSAASTVFGQAVTLIATVGVNAPGTTVVASPSGSVSFVEGATILDSATVSTSAGVTTASLTVASLAPGSHAITVAYGGDGNFAGSATQLTQSVYRASTTTTLSTSASTSVSGQAVTFSGAVAPVAPGAGTPSGFLTFFDGGVNLGSSVMNASGQGALTISSLAVAGHTITANYSGDTDFQGSSGEASQTVGNASTTTTLSSSVNPSVFGQATTLTAAVGVVSPGTIAVANPSGTVTFSDGATVLGTGTLSTGGGVTTASLTIKLSTTGGHPLTAAFSGDGNFLSSSSHLTQVVNPAGSTTSIAAAPPTSVFGQPVTLTATVSVAAPGSTSLAYPSGTVAFSEGGTQLGVATLSTSGGVTTASLTTASLAVGGQPATGAYSGDGNFTGSSGATTLTVGMASTATGLGSSVNPSVFGQPVTLTATISVVAPGGIQAGNPSGQVTFSDGAAVLGVGTLSTSSGVTTASLTVVLSVSSHSITAGYGGDGSFKPSRSASISEVVNKAATTTSVTSSANPTVFGQSTTFRATIAILAPGSAAAAYPSGTVSFSDGGTAIGSGSLSTTGGVTTASFSTSAPLAGGHSITATYPGDGNFLASGPSSLAQVVNKASTTTSLTSSLNPALFGQAVTFTATVAAVAPGAGILTGTVTFIDGGVAIGTAPLAAGKANLTTAQLSGGVHSITAVYGGDSNFKSSDSSSSPLSESITFTQTISGTTAGGLTVKAGQAVSITGTVNGSVNVSAGGALSITGGHVGGSLNSASATMVSLCGATVGGSLNVSGTTGLLLIGGNLDGPTPTYCAPNKLFGVSLNGNLGPVEVDGNSMGGTVNLTNTAAGSITPQIEGNKIGGSLNCSGNTPAPSSDGHPNAVAGKKSGQCNVAGM